MPNVETKFLVGPEFHLVQTPLQAQLVDFGMQSGPTVALLNLQEILGVERSGKMDQETLSALSASDIGKVNLALCKRRLLLFARVVNRDPSQVKLLVSWISRAVEFI